MADYHVLEADNKGGQIRVVFHIEVPNENNLAGYNIRAALSEDTKTDKTSVVPWIEEAEQSMLANGELIEHIYSFKTNKDVPAIMKRDRMDTKYALLVPIVQEALRQRYTYWRFNRSVA